LFGCQDYEDLNVQVEIKNQGADPMTDITVYYQFENEPVVSESFTGTIEPGESVIHEFGSSVSLPSNGIYDMKAWIESPGDENAANDIVEGVCKLKSSQFLNNNVLIDFDDYNNCAVNPSNPVCDESCYLDNKYYNMQNGLNDDIDWRVLSGITPTQNTGPIGDHTSGTAQGKFLYLEASGECYNKQAVLTTPCIELSNLTNPVAVFWVNMNGADMGSLHVDVVSDGVLHKDVMPSLSGDWGQDWHEAHVYLSEFQGKNITLRFRGFTGNGELSDLAIDDLIITQATDIEELSSPASYRVFPNPSDGSYNLVLNESVDSPVNIRVVDLSGRTIYSDTFNSLRANQATSVDIQSFENGIYFMIIESGDQQFKEKLIKY
jgi:hypothetical protein